MTLKLAVVGLGEIAQKGYLPLLSSWKNLELLLHTRTPEKVEKIKQQYRIDKGTTDIQELLSWQPQAACIISATDSHYDIVKCFLESNVDVFVEKPAARTVQQTKHLAEIADQNKRIFMVGFNRRFAPLSQKAKQVFEDRKISLAYFHKSRSKPFKKGLAPHVVESMIHLVDQLRFLCGEAHALQTSYFLDEGGFPTEMIATIKLEKGGLATITSSMYAGKWLEYCGIHGQSATIHLNQFRNLRFIFEGQEQIWEQPYDSSWESNLVGRGLVAQLTHFFECVQSRSTPQTDGWDSVRTQTLVEEIISNSQAE